MSTITSAASNVVTLTGTLNNWWLSDPADQTSMLELNVKPGPQVTFSEAMTVHRALGRSLAVVVSDVITGQDGKLTLWVPDITSYNTLTGLIDRRKPLLLQTPYNDQRYVWITLTRNVKKPLQGGFPTNVYREVEIEYVEVDKP